MPYIKAKDRQPYIELVESVIEICKIADAVDNPNAAGNNSILDIYIYKAIALVGKDGISGYSTEWRGNLNYLISKLCHEAIKIKGLRYYVINDIIGILVNSDGRLKGWNTTEDWKDVLRYFIRNLLRKIAFNVSFIEDELVGVMECCKLELYATVARPYEDKKRTENGCVSELDDDSRERMR